MASKLQRLLRRLTGRFVPGSTVIAEWEYYARDYQRGTTARHGYLGEDWNDPATIGAEVPAERFVDHVIETVVLPNVGTPASLLEIGCGAGRFTLPLSARLPKILAADTSPAMLAILRSRLPAGANVELRRLDGRGLTGIADRSVGAAFSYDVLVHLHPHDTYAYLDELRRVLVPGGRAVLHHSNILSELGWKKFLSDHARHRRGEPPKGQFAVMTPDLMRELATRAGLEVNAMLTGPAASTGAAGALAPATTPSTPR